MSMTGTLEIQTKVTGASEAAGQLANVKGAVGGVGGAQEAAAVASKANTGELKNNVVAANNLATAGFAVYGALDAVEAAQVRVAKSNQAVEGAQIRVAKAQEKVNKLLEDGDDYSDEYKMAQDELEKASGDLEVAQMRQAATADDVGQATMRLALTAVPSAITVLTSLRSMTFLVTAAQWLWNIAQNANPIGLIIMAIVALIAVLAIVTNGFQDWTAVTNVLNAAGQALWSGLQTAWAGLQSAYNTIIAPLFGAFQAGFDALIAAGGAVVGFFSGLGASIGNAFRSGLNVAIGIANAFIGGINLLIGGVNAIAGALGLPTLGTIATIPTLQFGTTFVPETGLALLHRGEAVVRSGEAGRALAGEGGGGGPVTKTYNFGDIVIQPQQISSDMDIRSIAEGLRRHIQSEMASVV